MTLAFAFFLGYGYARLSRD
jgi:hypothetical protein